MKKRALSIVLSFSMMLSLMPTTAFAEDSSNLNNVVEIQNVNAEASEDAAPEESEAAETSMFTEDEGTENLTSAVDEATEDLSASEEKSAGELPSAEAETENAETPVGEETAVASSEATSAEVAINEENFPDENFRSYVTRYDLNGDGMFSESEIAAVTEIDVYSDCDYDMDNLKGIEFFTELKELQCISKGITELDVSRNVKLEVLRCSDNELTSLDVSKNIALEMLLCGNNPLETLDVDNNLALTELYCFKNNLTELNLSKNIALKFLDCSENYLTSLDLNSNTLLEDFHADHMYAYDIVVSKESGMFDLATLPGAFDVNRTSGWDRGKVDGNTLTATKMDGSVYYTYDCGQDFSMNCTLNIPHDFSNGWSMNEDDHWRTCSVCGERFDWNDHEFIWKIDKEFSETEEGIAHKEYFIGKTGVQRKSIK